MEGQYLTVCVKNCSACIEIIPMVLSRYTYSFSLPSFMDVRITFLYMKNVEELLLC